MSTQLSWVEQWVFQWKWMFKTKNTVDYSWTVLQKNNQDPFQLISFAYKILIGHKTNSSCKVVESL